MNVIKYMFGADSKQYETTVDKMKRSTHELTRNIEGQFKRVGGAIAGYLSFTAIKGAIDDAINYFDNLAHKAEQLGVSASFLQVFEHAMRSVGGSSQQADKAIADFGKKVGEAMQGTGTLAGILDRLGIALYTADGAARPLTEIMGDYANAMANAATPQEKLFLSAQAFGEKAGPKMVEVLKGGAAGMNEMMSAFQKAHPEFETTAKRLSAASQALEDLRTKMTIFVGETIGYWLEHFLNFDAAILESKRLAGDVFFGIGQLWANVAKTLTFGLVDFTDKVLELRVKFDSWLVSGHDKTMKANAEQKGAIDSATESLNAQVDAIEEITNETENATKAAKILAREADAQARAIEARLEAFFGDINDASSRRHQDEKAIIMTLIEQGNTLDQIALRYPNLKAGIEASKTEYEKAAEAAAKIKENVDAATDATRKLAEEAGNVSYPDPSGSTGGKPNLLSDQGTYKKGGGVPGSFVGMNADLSGVSVSELLRMADELAEKKAKYKSRTGEVGLYGGPSLSESYVKTIQNILDNINKELYYRAQEEAGASAGMVPKAGFSTPEQYFKRLDDFIEKLYEKEDKKDMAIEKNEKVTQIQTEATKKLASSLDRLSGSLERTVGYQGRFRP